MTQSPAPLTGLEPRPGDGLAVRPASKLPPELADELRHHKPEIIRLLTADSVASVPTVVSVLARKGWGAVPPYNMELVTLKPKPTLANRDLIIAYLSRQCAFGHPEWRAWLTQRRAAYISMTAGTWDTLLITYAVDRDAACWQLNRTEAKGCALLEGIESCFDVIKSDQIIYCVPLGQRNRS